MKRKLVAFLTIMAVCANLNTTAFAARESNWSDSDWEEDSMSTTVDGTVNPDDVKDTLDSSGTSLGGSSTDFIPVIGSNGAADGITSDNSSSTGNTTDTTVEDKTEEPPKQDPVQADQNTPVVDTGKAEVNDSAVVDSTDHTGSVKEDANNASTYEPVREIVVTTQGAEVAEDSEKKEESKDDEKTEKEKRNEKIQQELRDYAKSLGFTDNRVWGSDAREFNHEYAEQPVIGKDSCTAGKLADSTLKEGLNLINMIRKTAGLGEVTLDDAYNQYAQDGALIMKASEDHSSGLGGLSHNPVTQGMTNITEDQNTSGHVGTRKGNIAKGHTSLTDTILNGYMWDGHSSNITSMGHRRWILNPTMGKVGFGQVGEYNCMYAHDNSNPDAKIEDIVTWPAENMPVELMPYSTSVSEWGGETVSDTPWTCQLGTNYKIVPSNQLTITVTYPDGHEYKIPSNRIFCNNQKYGYTNGCITFRADDFNGSVNEFTTFGNNYSVKIDGVIDSKTGEKTTIEYDVNFFSLFDK
nr:CAP domain-containing protein [uncultured Schaedlerella sp.]